jgi:TatD DNase family protein
MSQRPVDVPRLGAQLADSHAHLSMLDDPIGALERATLVGVMLIITVADTTEAPSTTYESLDAWRDGARARLEEWDVPHGVPPQVRVIVGTHPHNAKSQTDEVLGLLRELAARPETVGIGEIGLDYHYDHSPRDIQRRVFREQLLVAHELGLPVVIHLRDAHDEGREILEEVGPPEAGCVLHCFTEGPSVMRPFVDMGCYVSFAGPTTFKKADGIRAAAAEVPAERMLVETDCPFLAPEPCRGRSNEPAWATFTAQRIAEVRGESPAQLGRTIMANTRGLFRVDAPEEA